MCAALHDDLVALPENSIGIMPSMPFIGLCTWPTRTGVPMPALIML